MKPSIITSAAKRSRGKHPRYTGYHHNYDNNKRNIVLQQKKLFFVAILFVSLLLCLPLTTSGLGVSFSSYLTTGRTIDLQSQTTTKQGSYRSRIPLLQLSSSEQQEESFQKEEDVSSRITAAKRKRQVIPEFDPSNKIEFNEEKLNVGNPQVLVKDRDLTVTDILLELAAIRQEGPQKYCILGSRHCSYLHQQIIELLAYALVLSGNHVYTSGAQGTNAAAVRGALRANQTDLLTVVLPQSMAKQDTESQELLLKVDDLITFPHRDDMSLEIASKLCNSFLLNQTDQLISFAFHESSTVIEAAEEAREQQKLVTMLFLD